MPLFHHNSNPNSSSTASSSRQSRQGTTTRTAPEPQTQRTSGGFFGSRHDRSPTAASTNTSSSKNSNGSTKHSTSLLRRNREDPSISAAREQVVMAEGAEREADRALVAARQAVRDAREHVKRLEKEAAEEARLARVKQDQAADISKRARPLGRFGN
ncbi:hypothetical protein UA08_07491 [Talaromyces atroroseus]|uniref:Uncharacterized protein n=1 Tax=Talaromyces atroroseus TaxID=1441469 RepID=A0A225ASB3_TALAT|nr:hypothetical protein UA08_07491 [Talaromyces atroroseus]OKL57315.1 hypothetical protein UA08_07491 [Talaromyces atroroseus]